MWNLKGKGGQPEDEEDDEAQTPAGLTLHPLLALALLPVLLLELGDQSLVHVPGLTHRRLVLLYGPIRRKRRRSFLNFFKLLRLKFYYQNLSFVISQEKTKSLNFVQKVTSFCKIWDFITKFTL